MNILAINKHGKLENEALKMPSAPYTKPLVSNSCTFFPKFYLNLVAGHQFCQTLT